MAESEGPGSSLDAVWIYCSYPVVTSGLRSVFEGRARVHAGRSEPEEGFVPSCVIFDTGGTEGFSESLQRIRRVSAGVPILLFSLRLDLPLARAGLRQGAKGFVHAGMELDQIARAAEVVAGGEIAVPRKLLDQLVAEEETSDLDALTTRQQEILRLVAEGLSNAGIAQRLFLSESTVKQHLRAAYKVLGVGDRREAARLVKNLY